MREPRVKRRPSMLISEEAAGSLIPSEECR